MKTVAMSSSFQNTSRSSTTVLAMARSGMVAIRLLTLNRSRKHCSVQAQRRFPMCSFYPAAKAAARALGKTMGLNVIESAGVAKHTDHDSSKLQPDEFRSSLWSEFMAAQQAEHLIALGRFSGFSIWAASMGFMPLDNVIDGNSCKVGWGSGR
mmetsp:Transcript_64358/g.123855  ORF Transcript_64358/g.123855 Transcript_64358/m.123855 type:complete len:153 (+) Transcript_64358:154-612(+)